MKSMKRFIAALMAVVMLVSLSSVAAFASKGYRDVIDASELGYQSYFVFGDSIATGYLSEQSDVSVKDVNIIQTKRDGETTYGAYPTMIADGLGLDTKDNPFGYFGNGNTQRNNDAWSWNHPQYAFYNYARDGLSSHEIRLLVDPSYYNQMSKEQREYTDNVVIDGDFTKLGASGFRMMQKHCLDDLSKSDVITLWFGSNDLLTVLQTTMALVNDDSITGAVKAALATVGVGGAFDALIDTAALVGKLPIVLATVLNETTRVNNEFAANWDAILKIVNENKKPTAKIYVGDIYNSNAKLKYSNTSQLRIGQMMGISATGINNVINNTSRYRNTYTVVHTAGVEDYLPEWEPMNQWSNALSEGYFYTMFMVCVHPRFEGQVYLANEFLQAMKDNA